MDIIRIVSCIFLSLNIISGEFITSTLVTDSEKSALRYGFHQTSECSDYEKAFLCIRKCLDKGYDIAYSDKYCFCTCYANKQKAKYTSEHYGNSTLWKRGTPKTTKPAWVKKLENVGQTTIPQTINVIKKIPHELENATNATDDILNIGNKTELIPLTNQTTSDITNAIEDQTSENATNGTNIETIGGVINGTDIHGSDDAGNGTDSQTLYDATNGTNSQISNDITNGTDSQISNDNTNGTDSQISSDITNGTDSPASNNSANATNADNENDAKNDTN